MLLPSCFSLFTSLTIIGLLLTNSFATPTTPSAEEPRELSPEPGLDLSRRQIGQTCGPVTGANVTGKCFDASNTCCLGFYTRGFCPGPGNIRCCTTFQRCTGRNGFCNDINHVSCSMTYLRGLCPGPSSVRCCPGASVCNTPGGP